MKRNIFGWTVVLLAVASAFPANAQKLSPRADIVPSSQYRPVISRYCVNCHNERLKAGGLALGLVDLDSSTHVPDVDNVAADPLIWENVVRKLRGGAMPPLGMSRPDKATLKSIESYLETTLDRASAANPNPGRPAAHRLNRTEYANAIHDMLAVDFDSASMLPSDDAGYGFDNIADALTLSPIVLERYLSAAGKIGRIAIGDRNVSPVAQTFEVPESLRQDDRVSEDLPFGSHGGESIHYNFPVDGEYSIKIRLRANANKYIYGLHEGQGEPHQIEIGVNGERIKVFTVGGERRGMKRTVDNSASDGDEQDPDIKKYELSADEKLQTRFSAKAGSSLVGVSFVESEEPEGILHPLPYMDPRQSYKVGDPEIASVTIEGPYNSQGVGDTASRRKIFECRPASTSEEIPCATKILSTLTRRAYRRPVTDKDVAPLLKLYNIGKRDGGFESGIEMALEAILVSPEFLFRVERDPPANSGVAPGTAYRINDLDMASRLSFFLWSSIPDDQLIDLAAAGELKDPAVLDQQVHRMLADSRSKALVDNFAGQWLLLRNIDKVVPDADLYADFDDNLRKGFEQETTLFFQSMVREDHSVLDLLNANYTFLNERLAEHYGIPNIHGSYFRRVTLTDENRRGLLGQGSLLTVTSYATRTSVVLRGKWLLENFLGTPLPTPPNNVPSLTERNADGAILSVRRQMEQHRANPACAVCHVRMDPLGFALENFDAVGKWRTTEGAGNTLIDSTGEMSDGTKFHGPAGLRKVLLSKPDLFATTVTEKLLMYALGRQLEYYDEPAVRKIVHDAAPNDYRWSSLISGIIHSTPFQMRRSPQP